MIFVVLYACTGVFFKNGLKGHFQITDYEEYLYISIYLYF